MREHTSPMVFEHIEKLKREYTDKFVVIDASRPELVRFRGLTGQVKTVNMSGRALVEFDGYNNIGWYDIDIDFLKVVDAPEPKAKATAEPATKAPAAKKKAAPAKKPAAAKSGGDSVDDILAAARAGKKPKKDTKPAKDRPAEKGGGMSVDDILAAARSGAKAKPAD